MPSTCMGKAPRCTQCRLLLVVRLHADPPISDLIESAKIASSCEAVDRVVDAG